MHEKTGSDDGKQRQYLVIISHRIFRSAVMTITILVDYYQHSVMETMTDDSVLCVY